MKTLKLIAILLMVTGGIKAQNLINVYKRGNVKLVAESDFGKSNDWNSVFSTYKDTLYHKHVGARKSLVLLPDGSVIVNNTYRDFFTLFNPDGNFYKNFSIRNSSDIILSTPSIKGVLDNEILFTGVTNYGKMFCCDISGKLIKTLDVDYMTGDIIPLPGRKLAIVGWAIWDKKFRDFLAIKDYETGEENIIWSHFTDRSKDQGISVEVSQKNNKKSIMSLPSLSGNLGIRPRPMVRLTKDNEIMLAIPPTGELIFFDLDGKELRSTYVGWDNEQTSVEEQQELYAKRMVKYKQISDNKQYIERFGSEEASRISQELIEKLKKEKELYMKPEELPFISTILQDSDNNLLFFEYPKEKGSNQFNVYAFNHGGKFVCKSSFVCDNYDLIINSERLKFFKGCLYGLQKLKSYNGVPLRLVKFQLENE